jgi:hypothetical protein
MVFTRSFLKRPGKFPTRYFRSRYQSDGYLIGRSTEQNNFYAQRETERYQSIVSKWDNEYAKVSGPRREATYWTNRGGAYAEQENAMTLSHQSKIYNLMTVLNMGVSDAGLEAIEWSGNKFALTNKRGNVVVGELVVNGSGRPEGMEYRVDYVKEGKNFKYKIFYEYSDDRAIDYLPSGWEMYLVEEGGRLQEEALER